jgi:hypothetical protein
MEERYMQLRKRRQRGAAPAASAAHFDVRFLYRHSRGVACTVQGHRTVGHRIVTLPQSPHTVLTFTSPMPCFRRYQAATSATAMLLV